MAGPRDRTPMRPLIDRGSQLAARLAAAGSSARETWTSSRPDGPSGNARESPLARSIGPGAFARDGDPVTSRLYDRLGSELVAEVERRVAADASLSPYLQAGTDSATRRFLILTCGIWLGVEGVPEASGLTASQPPQDVHAMARGPFAAAGGLYESDLVVAALTSAGVEVAEIGSALDFGCSSGRVVRVLSAAFPSIAWHGCDPNEGAIAWCRENLPGIEFFVSSNLPPLGLPESSLDLVYAISIWSHFSPSLGLRWFDEMHRLLRPGGHLVCTTHGLVSIAYYAQQGLRSVEQSREIEQALYRDGWWYAAEFGAAGDWGVINPDWGTAFVSAEWLLTQLCPRWRVLEFAPGRNQYNQDVYVLQRV